MKFLTSPYISYRIRCERSHYGARNSASFVVSIRIAARAYSGVFEFTPELHVFTVLCPEVVQESWQYLLPRMGP